MLSHSQLIVNTYESSFAVEAAMVHLRPIVSINNGHVVHHSSTMLPYCGMGQFVKAYGKQVIVNNVMFYVMFYC